MGSVCGVEDTREVVEAQFLAELGTAAGESAVDRDADRIGDAGHPLEIRGRADGFNQRWCTNFLDGLPAQAGEFRRATDEGFGDSGEECAVGEVAIDGTVDDGLDIDLCVGGGSTPTERLRVGVCSVEAFVDGGDAGSDKFELRAAERAIEAISESHLL